MVLLPLLLGACATAPSDPQPVQLIPTALQLTITGATETVLGSDGTGRIQLVRDGTDEPLGVEFANGAPAIVDLQPGEYRITSLGPLTCRGLSFDVEESSGARALGSVQAEIITTNYYVALMTRQTATAPEISELAERAQTTSGTIDTRPITVAETAPCFMGRGGPGTTWRVMSAGEQIMLGIGFAAFCAVALASGGFCAF